MVEGERLYAIGVRTLLLITKVKCASFHSQLALIFNIHYNSILIVNPVHRQRRYNRRVLAGEFPVVNKYLLNDLVERKLWTPELRNELIAARGSVQAIPTIPQDLKDLYRTVWEIKQKVVIDQVGEISDIGLRLYTIIALLRVGWLV